MQEGDMDDFLNQLDIGGTGFDRFGKRGFDSVDDMVDWWTEDKPDDWAKEIDNNHQITYNNRIQYFYHGI
jgi:ribosomal protein L15